ncbi:hypothetical protein HK101_006317 [Irineochytrium annulatum]|nr:hypothetical protein HK101_006317 [Irineochytrium annulatum]
MSVAVELGPNLIAAEVQTQGDINGLSLDLQEDGFLDLEHEPTGHFQCFKFFSQRVLYGNLQHFLCGIFEGQIIKSIAVIIGLAFLCEYIVMDSPIDPNGNLMN